MTRGDSPNATDRRQIRLQLGRLRYQPVEVTARCYLGYPAVVKGFHPAGPPGEGEPLSTSLHWVTCPWLEKRIQAIENGGWLHHLRWLLAHPDAEELRERLREDAGRYTNLVREALNGRSPEIFEKRFGQRIMGVGGTSDPLGLKCLHNHAAWSLAGGESPLGELALALVELDLRQRGLGPLDCGRDCQRDPEEFGLRRRPGQEV